MIASHCYRVAWIFVPQKKPASSEAGPVEVADASTNYGMSFALLTAPESNLVALQAKDRLQS
jgi:hypothetical protein